jgi:hypothetical protein
VSATKVYRHSTLHSTGIHQIKTGGLHAYGGLQS